MKWILGLALMLQLAAAIVLRRQVSSGSDASQFDPMNMGQHLGGHSMNPFAAESQMNHAGFNSGMMSSGSSSSNSSGTNSSTSSSGSGGSPAGSAQVNPFSTHAGSGQMSMSGYSNVGNPGGDPTHAGNPLNMDPMAMNPLSMNPFASSNSNSSGSSSGFPSNMNPFGSGSGGGHASTFDPNKINYNFQSTIGKRDIVRRQSSGSGSIPKYDANAVNQLTSSMLDPTQSKLGPGGASGGMYDPDKWNTISFNFFNPQNQLGKRRKRQSSGGGSSGGSSGSSVPSYDPNKVNEITSSMLDPTQSKLGPGGASGGMYDPDKWNTIKFNFFDPQNQLGKRDLQRRQTQQSSASGGSSSGSSQSGGSSSPSQTGGSSGSGGSSQMMSPSMFTNPSAFMGGGSPSGSGSSSGGNSPSGGGGVGASQTGGSSGGGSMPTFDANAVNQITASFLDPSSLKLGSSGGGGGGFNPDQYNSKQFNFFNPNAMMSGGRK